MAVRAPEDAQCAGERVKEMHAWGGKKGKGKGKEKEKEKKKKQ